MPTSVGRFEGGSVLPSSVGRLEGYSVLPAIEGASVLPPSVGALEGVSDDPDAFVVIHIKKLKHDIEYKRKKCQWR